MGIAEQPPLGFVVALGIGLLIGTERERRKGTGPSRAPAGVRTFTITALLGALGLHLGGVTLLGISAVGIIGLSALAYWRSRDSDPGLTTEVSLLLTLLLGAWAMRAPAAAAAVAVVVAILLSSRAPLHRFVRDVLTAQELDDALLLAAATLVVLPLAPDRYLGPFNALNPRTIGTVVVVIMAIGAAGHVATRVLGPRYGLPISGLMSGFVSSVATIGTMGARARQHPAQRPAAVAGAVLSTVATFAQMAVVLSMVSPDALQAMALPLGAGAIAAALYGLLFTVRALRSSSNPPKESGRAFDLRAAGLLALLLAGVGMLAAALREWNTGAGVIVAAAIAGLVDTHATAASVASLVAAGRITGPEAALPVLVALSANTVSKIGATITAGDRRFAVQIIPGLLLVITAAWAAHGIAVAGDG